MNSEKCARCHAYLFENEDDIVYCPVCGAPHHRDCYQAIGHCALEEYHGTERQYDKIKEAEKTQEDAPARIGQNAEGTITCGMCRTQYPLSEPKCPGCGAPNIAKMGGNFSSFDFLGGVPEDCDIGDGITAEEAKRFVAVNTRRYIPKFAFLSKTNKASWNWIAFLFPCPWLLSRKMYKSGIIVGVLSILFSLFISPFSMYLYNNGYQESITASADPLILTEIVSKAGLPLLLFAFIGLFALLALRIVVAIFADYLYKNHTLFSIKKMRAESEDMDYDYQRLGGVNFILFFIGLLATQYIPAILGPLLG